MTTSASVVAMPAQEPPTRTPDRPAPTTPSVHAPATVATGSPAAPPGSSIDRVPHDDPLSRSLARAVSLRGRVHHPTLSRWWSEAGVWTDGMWPKDWVEYTRPGKKSPYRVPPERDAEIKAAASTPTQAAQVKPPYVEPRRNLRAPRRQDKQTRWWVPTDEVLYSQDSVTAYFTNGWSIGIAAQKLMEDPSLIEDYARDAPLEVWTFGDAGDRIVSFDNRRLWVFKHAGVAHVPVVWAKNPNSYNQQSKMTAPGGVGSAYITVLGGLEKEFKNLTAQVPDIDDPTINKLKHYQYW